MIMNAQEVWTEVVLMINDDLIQETTTWFHFVSPSRVFSFRVWFSRSRACQYEKQVTNRSWVFPETFLNVAVIRARDSF